MVRQTVKVKGKSFVLIEPAELRRLEKLASKVKTAADALPPLPPADAEGNRPAVAFARVSIARSIVTERKALGLTQEGLAKLSGLRQETISRLESGRHSPTVRTVEKIERALQAAARRKEKGSTR
jgi:DNA-binding XRE family transcriptional regulator